MIILNKNREIENHINKSIQLQNNTVLSIFNTNSGNIWAGLDNGIDLVQRDSYFRIFYPDDDLQGTGYTAEIFENELYLGTNTGLYKIPGKHSILMVRIINSNILNTLKVKFGSCKNRQTTVDGAS